MIVQKAMNHRYFKMGAVPVSDTARYGGRYENILQVPLMFHNLLNLSLADSTRKCDGTHSASCFILVSKLSEKEHKKKKNTF